MSDEIGPDGLTDQQRAAGYSPRRHSVAAGARKQPELASPLTAAELATGGGYGVAITDTDCTPRPRYGESQAKFLARMASYGVDVEVFKREIRQRNRAASLRGVTADGEVYRVAGAEGAKFALQFFAQCACGWCGLRVEDPEVARREYDAHECAAEGIGQDAVSRAQASVDRPTIMRRKGPAILQPALTKPVVPEELVEKQQADEQVADDATQRFALLEIGK